MTNSRSLKSPIQVNLLEALEIIQRHLTDVLCEEIFHDVRQRERQRKWTLFALARFWTVVVLQAPDTLTQMLEACCQGKIPFLPQVKSSMAAFCKKCKATHHRFFQLLYQRFVERVLPEAPCLYACGTHGLLKSFSGIWVIDGSRLDEIVHRMKILWKEKTVVLPGCLIVCYDLIRGISRHVIFDPDAARAELCRAESILDLIPKGTLLLGDRLYASIRFFRELSERNLWGLFRLNHHLKVKRQRLIRRWQGGCRTVVEEWEVKVGCGVAQEPIILRLIVLRQGRIRRELLTNVLDSQILTAQQALELYPLRWSVERVFFDLKEVCRLHSFYAANPNAVAMQVYAASIVHTAYRIAQAKIAQTHGISPEMISSQKLFSRLTVTSILWVGAEMYFDEMLIANRGFRLKKPDWKKSKWAQTTLQSILMEKRKDNRHALPKRTPMRWKSLAHISGALEN